MVYLITYDLNKEGQDYDNVIKAIKSASNGVWCSYWKSSFLIQSNYASASEVFRQIEPYIDGNDRVLVIEVKNNKQGYQSQKEWNYIDNSIFGGVIF